MSDHNFEKQIQQKLDELKIPPADTVWTGVEAQIRKDKRRRRGIIIFPMLFLLLGAGGYFILQNISFTNNSGTKSSSTKSKPDNNNSTSEKSKIVNDLTVKNQQEENTDNTTKRSVSKDPQFEQSHRKKTSENALSSKKAGNNGVNSEKIRVSDSEGGLQKQFNKNTAVTRNRKQQDKNRTQQESITDQVVADRKISEINHNKTIDRKQNDEVMPSFDKEAKEAVSPPDSQANKMMNDIVADLVADSININLKQEKPADTLSSGKLVEDKKTADKKLKQSGWKWGLNASAGISNLIDDGFFNGVFGGVLSEDKALVADVSNSAANYSPSPGSPTGIIYKPSAIEKGLSFSVGVFTEKNISKRFTISTGIQYRLYSANIQVGNRVDNLNVQVQNAFGLLTVSQYYRSAPVPTTYKYTNRFHFIELPVLFHAQLNKSKRLPLFWNAGLSLSYLVSTNALHFDGSTGVYYEDIGLFNKLQANFSTGFSVSLRNASKTPVHIGPQLQYGFTNLMKREVSASKHLYYFGLNTKVFLKK